MNIHTEENRMITLHVLAQSRALRIVWLLELIGAPYQIKTYARHPETLLAPEQRDRKSVV